MTTIGVICEDEALGSSLAGVLERSPDMMVRAVTRPGPGVETLLSDALDVLVIDEAMARWRGTPELVRRSARPKIVVVTADGGSVAVAAFVAGAEAVVPAHEVYTVLALVVSAVASGLCVVPRDVINVLVADRADVIDLGAAERLARLTPREREVLGRLMAGEAQPQVAASLRLSVHTVRFHVKQILFKLRVHSTIEAAMLAARAGMPSADVATPVAVRG